MRSQLIRQCQEKIGQLDNLELKELFSTILNIAQTLSGKDILKYFGINTKDECLAFVQSHQSLKDTIKQELLNEFDNFLPTLKEAKMRGRTKSESRNLKINNSPTKITIRGESGESPNNESSASKKVISLLKSQTLNLRDVEKTSKMRVTVVQKTSPLESNDGLLSPRFLNGSETMRKAFKSNQQYSQICENMKLLSEWTEMSWSHVVYDSNITNTSNVTFIEAIIKRENCLFIAYDENGNVFGAFIKTKINCLDAWNGDGNHFMFSLFSNGRTEGPTRWFLKPREEGGILIFEDDARMFSIGNGNSFLTVSKIGKKECSNKLLSEIYEGMDDCVLTGNDFAKTKEKYCVERIIVIQMK